jgi:hypothetical protein
LLLFFSGCSKIAVDRELKKGSTEVLILALVEDRPRHGYEIAKLIGETDRPYLYLPLAQDNGGLTLIVRTSGDPAQAPLQAIEGVRQTVRSLDPNLPVYDIKTMNQHVRGALVLGVLGCISLLLAGLGIYGVMARAVNRRTREIGIRIALGADARRGQDDRVARNEMGRYRHRTGIDRSVGGHASCGRVPL